MTSADLKITASTKDMYSAGRKIPPSAKDIASADIKHLELHFDLWPVTQYGMFQVVLLQ
jgi:hypothetical protein